MAHGSRLTAHGAWRMAHGSRLTAHGAWLKVHHLALSTCYLALFLSGCVGATAGGGDAANGKRIFNGEVAVQTSRGPLPTCKQCHGIVAGASVSRGPNLVDIGKTAGARVSGMSAEAYLRASLLDPDAYLVRNYQEGIMPKGYREALTDEEIADGYVLTCQSHPTTDDVSVDYDG